LHEIMAEEAGDLGAAHGFALAVATRMAGASGRLLWIQDEPAAREDGSPYGPGLASHGLDPRSLLVLRVPEPRLALWAMEQGLRCKALSVVIGEIAGLPAFYDLTASRRLVLAAREGGVTGLLVHAAIGGFGKRLSSAAWTRWIVKAQPSRPGRAGTPGRPAWRVSLGRNRDGIEAGWTVEWCHDACAFETLSGRDHADAADGPGETASPALRRAGGL
jgi:protein ImuA